MNAVEAFELATSRDGANHILLIELDRLGVAELTVIIHLKEWRGLIVGEVDFNGRNRKARALEFK